MTKKKKIENSHNGKLDVIAQTFDATDRRTTGASTNDPAQAFKPSGIEFREKVLGKTPSEFGEHFNIPNIIKRGTTKRGEKK